MAAAPVYSTRFRLVAVLVLAVAATAFVLAYLGLQKGSDDPVVSSGAASEAVERLIPAPGSQVPQQETIGVDLAGGWSAALTVNGVEIPADELDATPELSLVQFTPDDSRTVEQFRPGRNCVEATIWPLSEGRGGDQTRTIGWCFDVV